MESDDAQNESPLRYESYFIGPLRTLNKSLSEQQTNISLQDIANAYATLCNRIRACGESLYSIGPSHRGYESLETLKRFKPHFLNALKRDVASRCELDEHAEASEDILRLRHAALLLLSDVFKFRALYSILSDDDTVGILQDLLKIDMVAKEQPNVNYIVCWILSTQELPDRVLYRCKEDVTNFLTHSISTPGKVAIEALDASRQFLESSDAIFLRCFVEKLLSPTLQHLMSTDDLMRTFSLSFLTKLAYALIYEDSSTKDIRDKAAIIVGRFIEKSNSRSNTTRFESYFTFSYPDKHGRLQPATLSSSVRLLCTVMALISISGPQLFCWPSSLKLLLTALKKAKDAFREHGIHHKLLQQTPKEGASRNYVKEFAALCHLLDAAWRLVVWAYSQLSPKTACVDPRTNRRLKHNMTFEDLHEGAYKIVEQEFGPGVGVLMIAHILNPSDSTVRDIPRVLRLLSKLLSRSSWIPTGLRAFRRLLSSLLGEQNFKITWDDKMILIPKLLDGTILGCEESNDIIKSILEIQLAVDPCDIIPALSESEIAGTVWENLLTIWSEAVHHKLRDGDRVMSAEIVDIWQALILSRTQLTQGNGHLSVVPDRAEFLTDVLKSFILASQELRPDVEHIQSLLVVRQFWSVVRNVVAKPFLEDMAKDVLTCILTQKFSLEDDGVKKAWDILCVELVEDGSPRVLRVDGNMPTASQLTDSLRAVWKLAVERTLTQMMSMEAGSYMSSIVEHSKELLCVPIGQWDLTEDTVWDNLLRASIKLGDAQKTSLVLLDGVSEATKKIMDDGNDSVGILHGLLLVLDELYSNHDIDGHPTKLFATVRDVLKYSYPPSSATVDDCATLLALLSNHLAQGSATRRLKLLSTIKEALIPWLVDRQNILADESYNEILQLIYPEAINTILSNNPTASSITDFADFLAAPFLRSEIPRPAVGPLSFRSFWESIQHAIKLDEKSCPDGIKLCLYRLQEFGHPLPGWLQDQQSPTSVLCSPLPDIIIPSSVPDSPLTPKVPVSILALRASPLARRSPLTIVTERLGGASPTPMRFPAVESPVSPVQMALNRSLLLDGRPLKRQKLDSNAEASSSKADHRSRRSQSAHVTPAKRASDRKPTFVFGGVEVQMLDDSTRKKYKRLRPDQSRGVTFASPRPASSPQVKSEEDDLDEYSMWETGLSSQDLTDVLDLVSDDQRSALTSALSNESPDTSLDGTSLSNLLSDSADGRALSESMSVSHQPGKRVDRSRTVPAALPSYSPSLSLSLGSHSVGPRLGSHSGSPCRVGTSPTETSPRPRLLRRSATSPLGRGRGPTELLSCIERCAPDEMQTQVLAQTAEAVHHIAGRLRDAMARKLVQNRDREQERGSEPARAPPAPGSS